MTLASKIRQFPVPIDSFMVYAMSGYDRDAVQGKYLLFRVGKGLLHLVYGTAFAGVLALTLVAGSEKLDEKIRGAIQPNYQILMGKASEYADKNRDGTLSLSEIGDLYEKAGVQLTLDVTKSMNIPPLTLRDLETAVNKYESRRK